MNNYKLNNVHTTHIQEAVACGFIFYFNMTHCDNVKIKEFIVNSHVIILHDYTGGC